MNEVQITSAQYISDLLSDTNTTIRVIIDGQEMFVPTDPANRYYAEIMRQVEAGTRVIAEAE